LDTTGNVYKMTEDTLLDKLGLAVWDGKGPVAENPFTEGTWNNKDVSGSDTGGITMLPLDDP
jgi:hypothetical protein